MQDTLCGLRLDITFDTVPPTVGRVLMPLVRCRNGQGMVEYNERITEQESLITHGSDITILQQALAAFPRLRDVVFGDYRNLAREGEDYASCCTRLFGAEVLPPRIPSDPSTYATDEESNVLERWKMLFTLLECLNSSHVQLKSLTIGSHLWSITAGHCEPSELSSTELAPIHLLILTSRRSFRDSKDSASSQYLLRPE